VIIYIYTESEQSLYRFFGICEFIATVPLGIIETKRGCIKNQISRKERKEMAQRAQIKIL